jgi:hypothetical protein
MECITVKERDTREVEFCGLEVWA